MKFSNLEYTHKCAFIEGLRRENRCLYCMMRSSNPKGNIDDFGV